MRRMKGISGFGIWVLGFFLVMTGYASAQASRGMGVSPEALPKELRDLSPKDSFVPSSRKKVGVIHALEGKVVVLHRATREAYFGMAGDAIYENDSLNTLADSRCRIRFVDEDVVTMAPETEFSVESFQDQRAEGKKSSLFGMLKGKAMFYAMRLFRYKDTRFTLNTPTVTVGVRGTKFGAHVYYVGEKKADRGVLVAGTGNEIGPYLAQAGAGGQSFTDAFSEDGVLNVGGQIVNPGQMFNGQMGQVIPTPPSVLQSFRQATGMGPQRTQPPTTQEEEGPPPGGTGEQNVLQTVADLQENVTTVTQVTGGREVEEAGREEGERGPRDIGYFAAMLTGNYSTSYWLEDVFVQDANHKQYSTDVVAARGIYNPDNLLEGQPNFGGDPHLTRINLPSYGDSGFLGDSRPISHTVLGSNSYMEWGYWTMVTPVTIDLYKYLVDNKAYYVVGEATQDLDRIRSLGNVAYSGNAWGTYWSSAGGADMAGSFSTKVNMGNGALTDFNLSVSGGGKSATISNASGSVYGLATAGYPACSHFQLDPNSGSWSLSAGGASYRAASGTLYGPNAEHIGGVWGMKRDSSNAATGVFQGSR